MSADDTGHDAGENGNFLRQFGQGNDEIAGAWVENITNLHGRNLLEYYFLSHTIILEKYYVNSINEKVLRV